MSRSFKKNSNSGDNRDSDKQWKRTVNKKLRMAVKKSLRNEEDVQPEMNELSDVWDSTMDYKCRLDEPHENSEAYDMCMKWYIKGKRK